MSTGQEQNTAVALQQLPSEKDRLVMLALFPRFAPKMLFDYWTKPALICQWWPQQAEIDLREGGEYYFSWPKMNWSLRGQYTAIERGKALAFSWKWDFAPADASARMVQIAFEALPGGGTRLTLTHGFYTDSAEDQEERNGHLEGWTHFLGRLQQLQSEA